MRNSSEARDNLEVKYTNIIERYVCQSGKNILGLNEDAVAIKCNNSYLIVNIDGWVESTDRPYKVSYFACGYRALLNAASDIIAKGAPPSSATVSISIPKNDLNNLEEIVQGISKAASDYNIDYLGGDLNSSIDLVIDVAIWGIIKSKRPIRRDNAQVDQLLCWLGPPLGEITAALGILTKGWIGDKEKALNIYSKPKLYPNFLGIAAKSAIDSSDGLAVSLMHLSNNSNVGFDISQIKTDSKWVKNIAETNDKSILDLILYGGEELGVLFTCDKDVQLPKNVIIIGKVIEEKKIMYDNRVVEIKGWQHFS